MECKLNSKQIYKNFLKPFLSEMKSVLMKKNEFDQIILLSDT